MKHRIFPAILTLVGLASTVSAQEVFAPRGVPIAPPEDVRQLSLTPEDRAMVHELLTWIVEASNGKYAMPSVEPVLLRITPYAMSELACPSNPYDLRCRVFGMHHTGSYVVLVIRFLSPEDLKHVALHELVHYLQSRLDPTLNSCMSDYQDEREAYVLQQKYRSLVQGYTGPMPGVPAPCIDDETRN